MSAPRPDLPSLFYCVGRPFRSGGDLVNAQHVAALRAQGLRAFALLSWEEDGKPGFARPVPVPNLAWTPDLRFREDDWVVLPESLPARSLEPVRNAVFRRVIHNQNPYYTFTAFPDIAALNDYPLAAGLACSRFTAGLLQRWGSRTEWHVVRPAIPPMFRRARKPKRWQIAFMPRKRRNESAILRRLFSGLYPELARIPWVEIEGMPHPDVAQALGESRVFASLSRLEGLGLPPLEAMAADCLVCGYHGGGGREYATRANGLWVPDGDVEAFAHALAATLRLDDNAAAAQIAAGRRTASAFSGARLRAEVGAAWRRILDSDWTNYQLAPSD